jgi:hypothetical protein
MNTLVEAVVLVVGAALVLSRGGGASDKPT